MSVSRAELGCRLIEAGWVPLGTPTVDHATYYRWHYDRRVELHLLFDVVGRLQGWSVWSSAPLGPPDHEPGRRQRLHEYIERTPHRGLEATP